MLLGWAATKIKGPVAAALAVTILLALAALTQVNLSYWQNSIAWANHILTITPDSAFAHKALADAAYSANNWRLAEREYRAACANPDFLVAIDDLVLLYAKEGRPDEAIAEFRHLLQTTSRLSLDPRVFQQYLPRKLMPALPLRRQLLDGPKYKAEQERNFPRASGLGASRPQT
jgi:tetratricopeptide (TPR) repeat protein